MFKTDFTSTLYNNNKSLKYFFTPTADQKRKTIRFNRVYPLINGKHNFKLMYS